MSNFEQYLHELGYLPHKIVIEKKKVKGKLKRVMSYVPISNKEVSSFSTMMPGRSCNMWIKDDSIIIYGLNEQYKPPTLVSPRPLEVKERYYNQVDTDFSEDDIMNQMLKEKTPEEIYKILSL